MEQKNPSLFLLLKKNEYDPKWNRINFMYDVNSCLSLVKRLQLVEPVLEKHKGCVNTVNWNEQGTLLVSGSDEGLICIWDYENHKLKFSFDSGHSANIFTTKFIPHSDSKMIVSCSADHLVKVFNLDYSQNKAYELQNYSCHQMRVKKLSTDPENNYTFLSCSEDGTVRHFDIRTKHTCGSTCDRILVDLQEEIYSVAINQRNSSYFITGGSSPFIRMYDRRMIGNSQSVKKFCPSHLIPRGARITGVAYSHDGNEILGTYSAEDVYLFDVNNSFSLREDDLLLVGSSKKRYEENSYKKKYSGHKNVQTYKEVNFFGGRSDYVVSGSDDGNIFIWNKQTSDIEHMLQGDSEVVNCIVGHPFDCVLASSGIENNVKLFKPIGEIRNLQETRQMIAENRRNQPQSFAFRQRIPFAILHQLIHSSLLENDSDEDEQQGPECVTQ